MTNNEFNVLALYDFPAEGEHELSFNAQEILTITSKSAGNGWWYAKNSLGKIGAIPENYVQVIDGSPDTTLPLFSNTDQSYPGYDGSNTNDHNTQAHYQPQIEPIQYLNLNPSDDWSFADPVVSFQPNQTDEKDLPNPLNSISPPIKDENLLNTSSTVLAPYATVVDVESPYQVGPTSPANPFAEWNSIGASQDSWYLEPSTASTSIQPPPPQPFSDFPSQFEFPQPITMSPVDSIYDTPSLPVNRSENESFLTQSMPAVSTQYSNDNPSSTPPPPAAKPPISVTTDNIPPSPTNKKEVKRKFFTLGGNARKPDEKKRGASVESSQEPLPQSQKTDIDSNSFDSSESSIQNSSPNPTKQVNTPRGGDAKAAPPRPRFFDKHGVDSYLLHGCKAKSDEHVEIAYDEKVGGVHWSNNPNLPPFTCKIEETAKRTKLGGLKAFVEYKILAQIPGGQTVGRRYKHFDWLYEQLVNKFRFICVPPLPEKQIAGRFESEFIEERGRQLEIWLNRICHHPVLCASFPVQHFVTCEVTDKNDKDWKTGKRRTEKDELREASWLHCVSFTSPNLSDAQIAQQIDAFAQQQPGLETHLKSLSQGLIKYLEKHTETYERDIQRVSELFSKVHTAFVVDTTTPGNPKLSNSIAKISSSYNGIAALYKNKATEGLRDLNERLQEYIGLLACFPTILSIQRSASEFIRSVQQRSPTTTPDSNSAIHRGHVLNHVVLAEINFFQMEKVNDFNLYMKKFVDEQSEFYEKIKSELCDVLSTFS